MNFQKDEGAEGRRKQSFLTWWRQRFDLNMSDSWSDCQSNGTDDVSRATFWLLQTQTCCHHLLRDVRVIRQNNWLILTLGADNRPRKTFRAAFCVVFPDETSESWMKWRCCSCVWQRNNNSSTALWTSIPFVNAAAAVTHTSLCHLLPRQHLCHEGKIPADVGACKRGRVMRREDANISWDPADWPTLHLQQCIKCLTWTESSAPVPVVCRHLGHTWRKKGGWKGRVRRRCKRCASVFHRQINGVTFSGCSLASRSGQKSCKISEIAACGPAIPFAWVRLSTWTRRLLWGKVAVQRAHRVVAVQPYHRY